MPTIPPSSPPKFIPSSAQALKRSNLTSRSSSSGRQITVSDPLVCHSRPAGYAPVNYEARDPVGPDYPTADPPRVRRNARDVPFSLRIAAYHAGQRVACDPPDDPNSDNAQRADGAEREARAISTSSVSPRGGQEGQLPSQFHCSYPSGPLPHPKRLLRVYSYRYLSHI